MRRHGKSAGSRVLRQQDPRRLAISGHDWRYKG